MNISIANVETTTTENMEHSDADMESIHAEYEGKQFPNESNDSYNALLQVQQSIHAEIGTALKAIQSADAYADAKCSKLIVQKPYTEAQTPKLPTFGVVFDNDTEIKNNH